MERIDGRSNSELRPLVFESGYIKYPEGSVLVSSGNTKVLCNASVLDEVPRWKSAQGEPGGWITAEYSMLPRSTHTRNSRETKGPRGRTQEIQRLIGRSLRAAVDLEALGEKTIMVDCDVLQADGGTRTASISGAVLAVRIAINSLIESGEIPAATWKTWVGAISAGLVGGSPLLDLCYEEDISADVDINVVMTSGGEFIEVQGTAEGETMSREHLNSLLDISSEGIMQIIEAQNQAFKALS